MGSLQVTNQVALESALTQAHGQYTKENQESCKIHEAACNYMPGGNTRTVLHTTPFPLAIDKGQDCHLTSADGTTYVDFLGEYTAGIYGHNHPKIKEAVESALARGWNYGAQNRNEPKLAETVCQRFPAIELVRFVNSGTEANMMAIATALAFTGRKKVLVFNKGYHGSTISGRTPSNKASINLPHEFVVGTYNDVEGTETLIRSLPKDTLAAILLEPMLGSGGCFAGSMAFLTTLRRLADETGALLIFDEVMTSRLKYNGFGYSQGVRPDLQTLGKWVGGGLSFGAFGGKRDIMSLYDPRSGTLEHPGTFNNNVFTMAAGIAGCDLLNRDALEELNSRGDSMREKVTAELSRRGIDGTLPDRPVTEDMHSAESPRRPPKMFIKGVGSLMAIHFAGPDKDLLQALFYHHMLQHRIYMAQRGFIALNIMLTDDHVGEFIKAVGAFCDTWQGCLKW